MQGCAKPKHRQRHCQHMCTNDRALRSTSRRATRAKTIFQRSGIAHCAAHRQRTHSAQRIRQNPAETLAPCGFQPCTGMHPRAARHAFDAQLRDQCTRLSKACIAITPPRWIGSTISQCTSINCANLRKLFGTRTAQVEHDAGPKRDRPPEGGRSITRCRAPLSARLPRRPGRSHPGRAAHRAGRHRRS